MGKVRSLRNAIEERNCTVEEAKQLVELFLYRTHSEWTRKRLKRLLDPARVHDLENLGIYGRVVWTDGQCGYVAGQNYPSEFALVRRTLI